MQDSLAASPIYGISHHRGCVVTVASLIVWAIFFCHCAIAEPAGDKPKTKPASTEAAVSRAQLSAEELAAQIAMAMQMPQPPLPEKGDEKAQELLRQWETDQVHAMAQADELARRFPESGYLDEAIAHKLRILSRLSQLREGYLAMLLSTTKEIAASHPSPELAAENDFFAIRAFVLAARLENMPKERFHVGVAERYVAFLKDHPQSHRRPVIMASLVRTFIAMDKLNDAQTALGAMKQFFPGSDATRRAAGELRLANLKGKTMSLEQKFSSGETLRVTEYRGKPLLLHVWSHDRARSTHELRDLVRLRSRVGEDKLSMVGVCLDPEGQRTGAKQLFSLGANWKHFFEPKGGNSEFVINTGIIALPTYLLLDADGKLMGSFTTTGELLPPLGALIRDSGRISPDAEGTERGGDKKAAAGESKNARTEPSPKSAP